MSVNVTADLSVNRAYSGATGAATPLGRFLERAVATLTRAVVSTAKRRRVSRDIRELRSLSDDVLRDIGIHRSEITSLVHQKAYEGMDRRYGQD